MSASEARRELEVDAAVLAIAAGLIHAVAAVGHFGEYWLFGAFFAVLAIAQVAWGSLVYRGSSRRLLVLGHVSGLILAHDRALTVYRRVREATRSQYWMLVVMVGFTSLGLWLLSAVRQ